MFFRASLIVAAGLACSACANQQIGAPGNLQTAGLQAISSASAAEANAEAQLLAKKTMAGKVLTALALERVTGLKPDPARVSEID